MPHPAADPERHQDFQDLRDTLHSVKKSMLAAIVPLMIAGIIALISNHYQQKNLVAEMSQLNHRMTVMAERMEMLQEKVIVMWSMGEWQKKYHAMPSTPKGE